MNGIDLVAESLESRPDRRAVATAIGDGVRNEQDVSNACSGSGVEKRLNGRRAVIESTRRRRAWSC